MVVLLGSMPTLLYSTILMRGMKAIDTICLGWIEYWQGVGAKGAIGLFTCRGKINCMLQSPDRSTIGRPEA